MILKFKQHLEENKNPCWDGYKQVGTKKKAGKTVPNCVPVVEEAEAESREMISAVVHIFAYGPDLYLDDYYACVSPTIWDISGAILEDYIDPDDIDEVLENMTDLYDLQDPIMNAFDRADEFEITIWSGLNPKSLKEDYTGTSNRNPYLTADVLDSVFTDCRKVMTENTSGSNDSEIFVNMIATSIKNSPDKLPLYTNSKEFNRIISRLGWSEDKLKAVLKYIDIKKQI